MRALIAALLLATSVALPCAASASAPPCPWVGFAIIQPKASSETRPAKWGNATIFVHAITATSDIVEIKVVADDGDDASILLKFNPAATKRLIDATNNHRGRRIAFVFGDEALLNVVIPGADGFDATGAQVSLRHGMERARKLTKAIRGCTGASATNGTPEVH